MIREADTASELAKKASLSFVFFLTEVLTGSTGSALAPTYIISSWAS